MANTIKGHKRCKALLDELVSECSIKLELFRPDNDLDYYTVNGPLSFCWMGIACCQAAALREALNTYDMMERDSMW